MIFFKLLIVSVVLFIGVLGWRLSTNQKTNSLNTTNKTLQEASLPTKTPNISPSSKPTQTPATKPIKISPTISTNTPANNYCIPNLDNTGILNLINNYRQSKGLWSLSVSDELCNFATKRADFLMQNGMAAAKTSVPGNHVGLYDQVQSYSGTGIAENFVSNVCTDQEALTAWQNSPPHNAVLLSTKTVREDQPPEARTDVTKACVATKVIGDESMVVLLVGDK